MRVIFTAHLGSNSYAEPDQVRQGKGLCATDPGRTKTPQRAVASHAFRLAVECLFRSSMKGFRDDAEPGKARENI